MLYFQKALSKNKAFLLFNFYDINYLSFRSLNLFHRIPYIKQPRISIGGINLLSKHDLELLSSLHIKNLNEEELQEINNINIEKTVPLKERFTMFLHNVNNPYCFKINGTPVQISFADNNKTIEDALKSYLIKLKDSDH